MSTHIYIYNDESFDKNFLFSTFDFAFLSASIKNAKTIKRTNVFSFAKKRDDCSALAIYL